MRATLRAAGHGSETETWPLKVEHESKLETTDMRMITWTCGVPLRDMVSSAVLRARIGVEPISDVCKIAGEID
jgi:hypothetical protein